MLCMLLLAVLGCQGLDSVPVLNGESCAPSREATVVRTLDGDTFETTEGEIVRLLGVNAPEIEHDGEAAECWGPEAADWLSAVLTDQVVRMRFDATCADTYGRTLAYTWTVGDPATDDDDVLINQELVRKGQARVYEDFDDIVLADVLYAAEAVAQRDALGLWGVCES